MEFHDIAAGVESIVTTVAIVVGGAWALVRFGWAREKYPKAVVSHVINTEMIDGSRTYVRVDLRIENTGSILLQLDSVTNRLQQVLPLAKMEDGPFEPKSNSSSPEVEWPTIKNRHHQFSLGERQIEPGESDTLQFDYIIDGEISVIQVYSYVSNRVTRKKGRRHYWDSSPREIGWNVTTIHHLFAVGTEKDQHQNSPISTRIPRHEIEIRNQSRSAKGHASIRITEN